MLTENSFFKRIPTAIALDQRLIWEGAGWAIEAISWSFDRLRAAASQIDTQSPGHGYPTPIAREIFTCCWSIIDQCHMLRKILELTHPRPEGLTHKFIEKFGAVTLIRNAMDHLHANINNIANDKESRPPLFGAISFCSATDSDVSVGDAAEPTLAGCRVVTLTAGALTHTRHQFRMLNPVGRLVEFPVGQFQFEAFKHCVNISDIVTDLAALVLHYDTFVKPDQENQLREFARTNGLDEEKIVNEHHVAMMIFADFEFPK
jgi:hypothetical protein